jgi:hypothetical protein
MAFDPDAYLRRAATPTPTAFDPDAYLKAKAPAGAVDNPFQGPETSQVFPTEPKVAPKLEEVKTTRQSPTEYVAQELENLKPAPPTTETGKGIESGKIAVKTIPESLSVVKDVSAAKTNLDLISLYDKIDKGELNDPTKIQADDFVASRARMYMNSRPEVRNTLREHSVGEIKDRREMLKDSVELIKQYQQERLKYKGKTENLTDVEGVKDFTDWAAFNFGSGMVQLVPVMLAAATTGGAGAVVTGTAMELSGGVQTRINKVLEDTKDVTDPQQRADQIRDYVLKTGDVTMAAALASGSLDAFLGPASSLLKKSMAETAKNLTKREVAKQIPKEAAKQGAEEFVAGGSQEAINIGAERALGEQTGDVLTKENFKRIIDSAAAESIAGVGVGAGVQTSKAIAAPSTVEPERQAPPVPPVADGQPVPPPVEPTQETKAPSNLGEYWAGTASDYGVSLGDIQNRDRSRPASIQQVQSIATNPDYNRVGVSGSFGQGAPVVITDTPIAPEALGTVSESSASDGTKIPVQYAVVEAGALLPSNMSDGSPNQAYGDQTVQAIRPVAGNGRVAGLQAAYANDNANDYRNALTNDPMHGIDPQVIEGMQNPVLVRVMPKSSLTPDIADKGNVSGELGMSPTEQAKIDMGRFDLGGVEFLADGQPNTRSVAGFVAAMPKEEQGALRDAKGQPNKKAEERLNNAIFARAYGNDALIDLHAEAKDPEAQTIMRGLAVAAPSMAKLENAPDHDLRGAIIEATEQAINAKRQGVPLDDYIQQGGLVDNPYTAPILQFFANNIRSAKKIGDGLTELGEAAAAQSAQAQSGVDMFGENTALPLDQVFAQWAANNGLTTAAPAPTTAPTPKKKTAKKELHQFQHLSKSYVQIAKEIESLQGNTLIPLADWAIDNAPNKFAKVIAQAVQKRLIEFEKRGVKVSFTLLNDTNLSTRARGSVQHYKPGFKYPVKADLKINGTRKGKEPFITRRGDRIATGGARYSTILHELLHAATYVAIEYGDKTNLIKDLKKIYQAVKKQSIADLKAGKEVPYEIADSGPALEDAHEILAWGLTNEDVQKYMDTVMVAPRVSAFTKFVTILRELVGVGPNYQSAMEQLASITEEMLDLDTLTIAKQVEARGDILGTPTGNQAIKNTPEQFGSTVTTIEQFLLDNQEPSRKDFMITEMPSYRRASAAIFRRLRDKKITDAQATKLLEIAYANTRKEVELKDRVRGQDIIIEKLRAAKRRGEITGNAVEFAEWFMRKNPNLVQELAVSTINPERPGVAGEYNPYMKLMTLIKGSTKDATAVHEILHHMERMMPVDVQDAIRKLWVDKLINRATKAADGDDKKLQRFFDLMMDHHFGSTITGQRIIAENPMQEALKLITNGSVPYEMYQFVNPSEFWAVNGSDIMMDRYNVSPRILAKLKQWLKEFVQKAKSLLGMESTSKIAKALDSIIAGDGKFQSPVMLADRPLNNIQEIEDIKEQSVDEDKAFARFPQALRDRINRQFKPESKSIIEKLKGLQDRFWQRAAQKLADQYRTIRDLDYEAYIMARLSKTVDGALEGIMFNGQVYLRDGALDIKPNTKGLIEILAPVGNELDVYQIWVAANRDARLPADKRSIDPEIVAARDELAAGMLNGEPRINVYERVRDEMNKLNKSILDIALTQGIIDQTGYDRFSGDIYYIPFYKAMEGEDAKTPATASGLSGQYFSRELKGGERPFGDLMENTLRNWSHILSASMKNAAARKTIDAAMMAGVAYPNLKNFTTVDGVEVPIQWRMEPNANGEMEGQVVFESNGKPIPAELDENGNEVYAEGELRPYLTTQKAGMAKIMMNGQPAYFEITDPLLLDSIMSIGYMGPKSKFLDVARGFKNILQFGVTLSPGFKVRNLFRDSISAIAVSDMKLNPVANLYQGWVLSDKNNPAHISALAGGAIFNFGSAYEGDQSKMIRRLINQGVADEDILDTPAKIKAGLAKAWNAYNELGNKSESANRMALYQQMIDKGASHLEASFYARDMLDFSMQGSWPAFRICTQVIPFLNARVQGLYKLGRDGLIPTARVIYNTKTGKPVDATDRQKALQFSIVMSSVALASMALYMIFKDDEEFKKREQWDRDNFWWIKLPGMDKALRIPKPFEIGAFGTIAERTLEQIYDKDVEGKVFGESMKRMLVDTFAINHPQFYRPLLDLYANKDSFTGAPIETRGMEELSKAERMTDKTSPLAIAVSRLQNVFVPESLEISPVQTEYAIKAYLGWLGGTAEFVSHYAVMPFSKGTAPNQDFSEIASMGFVKSLPSTQSKYMTAFYQSSKEISQAYADMRHYAEIGEMEKVDKIIAEKGDLIALNKSYDRAAKQMSKVRKAISAIRADEDMSGAEKKEEIDRLKMINNEIAESVEKTRIEFAREAKADRAAGR